MDNKKHEAIQEAKKTIEKEFGKGSIMTLSDNVDYGQVNTFSSGSYVIDTILGGGYPHGRVIEIYGPESSGKTTLALQAIAEIQKKGEFAAFVDAEHALDPKYANKLGVDTDNLLVSQPDFGEQALQIAEELAKTGAIKLIVIDSVSALVPKAEVEGDMGDSHMGLQARLMSQGLRKLASILSKTGTTVIFINQIRSKIGVMFGNPETTSGGNALKFFASQRIEIRRGEKIEENKEQIGYKAKVKIVKNKIAPPFKNAEVTIKFNKGIEKTADLIDAGSHFGIISRNGAFYSLLDQKVQGKDKLAKLLEEDKSIKENLEQQIKSYLLEERNGKSGESDENIE
ncbi:recombinase RecA [Candidatus Absconditicoccus praedator]|uniref:recombinase RecA n=1 Tax=Candidatus Absconditicoccus praedator TaxID=2735562 RepID=UPI0023D92381|nr:recombinase RecA [Candidatus Absconditicoccus praedator]UFX83062.1 recombinase RecA [Candidatus Absconditicoccus praedator]